MAQNQKAKPTLDAAKLRENALTWIRLGVEDFQRSQGSENPDQARALSSSSLSRLKAVGRYQPKEELCQRQRSPQSPR